MTVTASRFDAALEGLANRTASLVPKRNLYTSSTTWTKPANCLVVDIFVIDQGMQGASRSGSNVAGSGGGASGAWVRLRLRSEQVPSSLTITAAGGTYTVSGDSGNFVVDPTAHLTNFGPTAGAAITPGGTRGYYTRDNDGDQINFAVGGGGGAQGVSGTAGHGGYGGKGGAGGARGYETAGGGGKGGRGYGAGGGGAGGAMDSTGGGGGGGGGGGYGNDALAQDADGATGGDGAPGCIEIIAWCGVEVA